MARLYGQAGEKLEAGDAVTLGEDGKFYKYEPDFVTCQVRLRIVDRKPAVVIPEGTSQADIDLINRWMLLANVALVLKPSELVGIWTDEEVRDLITYRDRKNV